MRSFAERLWTLVSGGDDRLRVHGGERTAEPQRPASRDGDRANVARPDAGDHGLRAACSDVFQRNTFEARPRPVSFGTGGVSTVGVLG